MFDLLRFIIGSSTANKGETCISEIKQKLREDPQGDPIIYLVPDQMTFQQEYALLNDDEMNGSIRAQVFSFSRLAWRVMQLTGGATKKFITSTGIQMMLRKIIDEKASDFHVFQKAIEKQGFIDQLEDMITEFKRYCITPEMITEQIAAIEIYKHQSITEKALKHKLEDLYYIYHNLINKLSGAYMDNEDRLELLIDKLENTNFLQNTTVYVDGFHHFTPQELRVLEVILKKGKEMHLTLTLNEENDGLNDPLNIYHVTRETYIQMKMLAEKHGKKIEIERVQTNPQIESTFRHMDQYFDSRPAIPYTEVAPIQLAEAVHPRAEVEGVAQEIIRLVREENYRYHDIAILLREPNVYHDLITTIFEEYHIPVFVDEKRTMLHHPLIECIRSLLDVVEGDWRYDAVFRLLKTGFIPNGNEENPLTQEAIDELENYVLEYGIRGRSRWLSEKEWIFQRFRGFDQSAQTDREKNMQERINQYKQQVANTIGRIDEKWREAHSITDKVIVLYEWLEEMNVPAQLERMRDVYDEDGRIEKGREQEQVWSAILQLLEEITEIAGEETIDLKSFRNIIETGFETLQFSHVPPSIDHVVVGSIDRSRLSAIKCALLLGVNEGTWPMKQGGEGLISEEERTVLQNFGLTLAEGSKQQLLDDRFYVYLAFTLPTEYLWISYPISNEEGKTKAPSPYIKRIEELFPHQLERLVLQDPEEMMIAQRFVTTPSKTRGALTAQLARFFRGYPIDSIWKHVLNWYIATEENKITNQHVLRSLFYQNKPKKLAKNTVTQMYPKAIEASVSRLEMYYKCSYQHFSRYNLLLEERATYKLDAPDIGQLFHEALKNITEWINKDKKQFSDLYEQDAKAYAHRAMRTLAPVLQHQILHSSNRYKYIQQKLERVIARATYILSEQARKSNFAPVGLEVGFGYENQLQPLEIPIYDDYMLLLRGRIDRVDKARENEQLFLRIIDYKSSARGLSLVEVYYGLALQMLAYLDVVLQNAEAWLGEKAIPAGVLYFHVHNPMLSLPDRIGEDQIEKELFKQFKMKGLLLDEASVVQMMDTSLEYGRSNIVPAGISKTGGFYKGSQVAEEETFKDLQAYIHTLMKNAGLNMLDGNIELNPYQKQNDVACTFCSYRSVCQFDPTLEENNYRRLKQWKDEEVIERIKRGEQ